MSTKFKALSTELLFQTEFQNHLNVPFIVGGTSKVMQQSEIKGGEEISVKEGIFAKIFANLCACSIHLREQKIML